MSFIILNPLPEELKDIAKNGEMVIKSDLSLHIRKEDGVLEPIIGHKYEEFMFFLENQLKSFSGDVTDGDKYIKRFSDADLKSDKIIIYETDKDLIHATDEETLDSYQGCVIRYEKGSEPKMLIPFTDVEDVVYPHDPENNDNDSFLSSMIISIRNRLVNVEKQLPNLLRKDVYDSTMSTKFLQRGSINLEIYPNLKALTDKLEAVIADILVVSDDLEVNYPKRGSAFPIATFPTLQSLIAAFDILDTEVVDTDKALTSYHMPIGGGYTSATFQYQSLYILTYNLELMINKILDYQNKLPTLLDIGTIDANYPDVYSLGIKIDALSAAINTLTTTLLGMTDTYLYKGVLDTSKYPNVKVMEDLIETYSDRNATKLLAGVGLSAEYNTAYKLIAKMDTLSTNMTSVISQLSNKIDKGGSTYTSADELVGKLTSAESRAYVNNIRMNNSLNALSEYKPKGDTPNVPYPDYYTLYQDMTSAQSKLAKMEDALSVKKCLFSVEKKEIFTEMPKINYDGDITYSGIGSTVPPPTGYTSGVPYWSINGTTYMATYPTELLNTNVVVYYSKEYLTTTQSGSNMPTRLRPFYYNAYGGDDAGTLPCDSIVQHIVTKSDGNKYLVKLPWDENQQGIIRSEWEYKHCIWSFNISQYGNPVDTSFYSHDGSDSTCSITKNPTPYYNPQSSSLGRTYSGPRLNPGGYGWTGRTFACGSIGLNNFLWTINTSGQLFGVNLQAMVDGWSVNPYNLVSPGYVCGASVGDTGFGYYYSPISHVVDMGLVGGDKVFFWAHNKYTTDNSDFTTHDLGIWVGTYQKGAFTASSGNFSQAGIVTRKLTDVERKAYGMNVENLLKSYYTVSFVTPLTPNLLFWCNEGFGFFLINADGSVTVIKGDSAQGYFKTVPIIIRLQDTNLILAMDIKNSKYYICETEDFDYMDPLKYGSSQEGMHSIDSLDPSSILVAIRDAALRFNSFDVSDFLPFAGTKNAQRCISYELDYDGKMCLCVTNLRVKFKVNEKGKPDEVGILL